jgi:cation diffusion facilitator family transporter
VSRIAHVTSSESTVRLSFVRNPQWVALASSAIDLCLVVAKVMIGLATGSLALVSDGVHSSLDLIASVLAVFAVRAAARPADVDHPYGHGRAENLAAYTTGLLLLLAGAAVAYEAIQGLRTPGAIGVDPNLLSIGFLVGALLLEIGRSTFLRWLAGASGSPSIRALATDKVADMVSISSVLAGLVAVRLGLPLADPIAALVVAGLIVWAAVRLVKGSGDILMDRVAAAANRAVMEATREVPGVREVRSGRVRQVGAQLMGEVEVAGRPTLSLEGAQALQDRIQRKVHERVPNLELTVVVRSGSDPNLLVERVHAAAARNGNFSDLHDVIVEREADESLHLSLHAKLPGDLSMRQAAKLAADFEGDLKEAIPEVSRVDIHLEPLEPDVVHGRNVTAENRDVVQRIQQLVDRNPKVVACQDIELSSRFGHITAYVTVRVPDDLSLDQAHAIASELEDAIRHSEPSIHRAVVRAVA